MLTDQQLLTLQFAGETIVSNCNLEYVMNSVTNAMASLLEVEACAVSEWDQDRDELSVMVEYGPDDWWDEGALTMKFRLSDFPLTKRVLVERQPEQLTLSQPDLDPKELAFMREAQIKTLLMVPMQFRDRVVGLVEMMDDRQERTFAKEEIALVQFLANQLASAIEHTRLIEQAQREVDERRQAEEELRRSEARNKALLDVIPDLVFRITREGQILDCKGGQNLVFAAPIEDCIGFNISDKLPQDMAALTLDYTWRTLATGSPQVFEYQVRTSHGLQEYETRLVMSGQDEVLGIIRNITEHKQAVRTERLAALGQLATTLAHEINNPLQAIQSHLDLALNYNLPPERIKQHLDIIRQQIERLRRISRPVLNLATGKTPQQEQVSVIELVQQVLMLTERQLQQNNTQVITDFQKAPPVLVVPDQLVQVFLNLVLNAVEATSTVQSSSQLRIAVYAEKNQVVTSFTNNGPAIPRDDLPYIFEPFFSTKLHGNGLGLWASNNLTQQNDGSLTVQNLPHNAGVMFMVKLPAVQTRDTE